MNELQGKPQEDKNKVDPKLSQFTEELNELCDRYQYRLMPQLVVTSNAISATLSIANKIPPKKPAVKNLEPKKKEGK